LSAYWEPLEFEIPPLPSGSSSGWRRMIDTSLQAPDDFCEWAQAPRIEVATYRAQPRSVVLLLARVPRT